MTQQVQADAELAFPLLDYPALHKRSSELALDWMDATRTTQDMFARLVSAATETPVKREYVSAYLNGYKNYGPGKRRRRALAVLEVIEGHILWWRAITDYLDTSWDKGMQMHLLWRERQWSDIGAFKTSGMVPQFESEANDILTADRHGRPLMIASLLSMIVKMQAKMTDVDRDDTRRTADVVKTLIADVQNMQLQTNSRAAIRNAVNANGGAALFNLSYLQDGVRFDADPWLALMFEAAEAEGRYDNGHWRHVLEAINGLLQLPRHKLCGVKWLNKLSLLLRAANNANVARAFRDEVGRLNLGHLHSLWGHFAP